MKRKQTVDSLAIEMSPPTRGRGLKPAIPHQGGNNIEVAPHAGAWIETSCGLDDSLYSTVAPHAGAWIETRFA